MKLFKDSFSYENRCEESTRIKNKYPHRVPIIVEKAKNLGIKKIKGKFIPTKKNKPA